MTDKINHLKHIGLLTALLLAPLFINPVKISASSGPEYISEYRGQEKREIKSLSREDIRELRSGGGWGLAKAAELNGLPGPRHVLEMKNEIALTSAQEKKMLALYESMKKKAVEAGDKLIVYEQELNDRFAAGEIDEKILAELLDKIANTYKSLRFIHLSTHLKTPAILTDKQINKYNTLRGYTSDDPCLKIPQGHDPVMWRKHNNCN